MGTLNGRWLGLEEVRIIRLPWATTTLAARLTTGQKWKTIVKILYIPFDDLAKFSL